MSSDKSQVFLMKKFSGFYRMQTYTQANSRYAADPAPVSLLPLPGSIQTHGIAFAAKAPHCALIWLPYPAPVESRSAGHTAYPKPRT